MFLLNNLCTGILYTWWLIIEFGTQSFVYCFYSIIYVRVYCILVDASEWRLVGPKAVAPYVTETWLGSGVRHATYSPRHLTFDVCSVYLRAAHQRSHRPSPLCILCVLDLVQSTGLGFKHNERFVDICAPLGVVAIRARLGQLLTLNVVSKVTGTTTNILYYYVSIL